MSRLHRRSGFTLIECVTVMGGLTVLLAFSVALLHQMLRLDRGQRDRLVRIPTGFELDRTFRDDVHRAVRSPVVEPSRLSLVLSDGSEVRYVSGTEEVQRVRERKGHPPQRERYLLPQKTDVRFQDRRRGETAVLELIRGETLTLDRERQQTSSIHAVVGRDILKGRD